MSPYLRIASLILAAGCGRLGFDVTDGGGGTGGDGGTGNGGDGGVDAAITCTPTSFPCADGDLGSAVGLLTSGSIAGQGDDEVGSCGGNGELDVAFRWTAPAAGRWLFDTRGSNFDTVLYARDACGGTELGCNDDDDVSGTTSALTLDLDACRELLLVVDTEIGSGTYNLNARSKCPGTNAGSALGAMIATGTNTGWGDSYTSSCGGNGEADVTVTWTAPATGMFRFTTQGSTYDTVLSAYSTCTGTELICNDDAPLLGSHSTFDLGLTAGQTIVLVIDSSIGEGTYRLGVSQL